MSGLPWPESHVQGTSQPRTPWAPAHSAEGPSGHPGGRGRSCTSTALKFSKENSARGQDMGESYGEKVWAELK